MLYIEVILMYFNCSHSDLSAFNKDLLSAANTPLLLRLQFPPTRCNLVLQMCLSG